MPLRSIEQKTVEDFFAAIAPQESAYLDANFGYFAVRSADSFVLVQARLFLNTGPSVAPLAHFQSKHVRAGNYKLTELGLTVRELIETLGKGNLKTSHGDLEFPPEDNGAHGIFFEPFHQEGLQQQNRLGVLRLKGMSYWPVMQQHQHLDWELKASPTPYDSVGDLMGEFLTGPTHTDNINVEIVAPNVAAVDQSLTLTGTKAELGVILSKAGDKAKVSLGYRVFSQGRTVTRASISGDLLTWRVDGDFLKGQVDIEVPQAAVVQRIVSYAGVAQHQSWQADRDTVQNPLRAVYETFDRGLSSLIDVVAREGRGRGRDLEAGVSWLLWMLGFRPAHLGERISDGPDLIVTAPSGHFALVECTAGLLKADNKLALLHDRTIAVRRSLQKSNNQHLRVLPVIVTTKTREEIKPDLEQAERLGILVISREGLDELGDRTTVFPNADQIYQEAEDTVRRAEAKYAEQPSAGKVGTPRTGGTA